MPILYIHGEHDPRQPLEYCEGMEKHLPGLQAILVLDAGHFITRAVSYTHLTLPTKA